MIAVLDTFICSYNAWWEIQSNFVFIWCMMGNTVNFRVPLVHYGKYSQMSCSYDAWWEIQSNLVIYNSDKLHSRLTRNMKLVISYICHEGKPWWWLCGSWISDYLCNQCLWLWDRIPLRRSVFALCDKVCQWLAVGRWFPPQIKQTAVMYSWNTV